MNADLFHLEVRMADSPGVKRVSMRTMRQHPTIIINKDAVNYRLSDFKTVVSILF
jgi:hypothetical protein